MGEKNFGKTVMGWFIVNENQAQPEKAQTADELIAKYAEPPPEPVVSFRGELPRPENGAIDFEKIFQAAGISKEEQERVEKAKNLLKDLPQETPVNVRKQIVEASLKAFGIPFRDIIEPGVAEIEALESYNQHQAKVTQATVADAKGRIAKLTAEIGELQKIIQQAVDEQTASEKLSNAHKLTIQQVLEFFGVEEVEKVVRESPKLHEPT